MVRQYTRTWESLNVSDSEFGAMMYLEMSRDEDHGGGTWAFTNCVWSPSRKVDGSRWPFWQKILNIGPGDIVLHLRGVQPDAEFVGYSVAAGRGFETSRRPPVPGPWREAQSFFRADLEGFVPFHTPVNLTDVFERRRGPLERYFDTNKHRGRSRKLNIFFVRQSGGLRCQNGAYLSDVDEALLNALFGLDALDREGRVQVQVTTVQTGQQLATVKARLGQSAFASRIKDLYEHKCCFPDCDVEDARFLVASHIARWSDNTALRGNLGNGLCLCLIHDRAFELGLFTLNERYQVFVNPKLRDSEPSPARHLLVQHGQRIRLASIRPLQDALLEHWIRVDLDP